MANIYLYCSQKYKIKIPLIKDLMKHNALFNDKYYPQALEVIPEKYRDYIKKQWEKYCLPIEDYNIIKSFDTT